MADYLAPLNTKLDANQVLIRSYDEPNNRLRVDASVTAVMGAVDVIIDAASGDNIKISDGHDTLLVNSDGSINVVVEAITISAATDSIRLGDGTNLTTTTTVGSKVGLDVNVITSSVNNTLYLFNQINAVSAGVLTTIITYTVPITAMSMRLQRINCSGDNVSKYLIYINGVIIDITRTYFGSELNTSFDYTDASNVGRALIIGDKVEVKVIHQRPSLSDYNAKIQILGV